MATITSHVLTHGVVVGAPRHQLLFPGDVPCTDFTVEAVDVESDSSLQVVPTQHPVRVFGQLARNVNASLAPGDRVLVVGRFSSYIDEQSGVRLRRQRIIADVVAASLESATAVLNRLPSPPTE